MQRHIDKSSHLWLAYYYNNDSSRVCSPSGWIWFEMYQP